MANDKSRSSFSKLYVFMQLCKDWYISWNVIMQFSNSGTSIIRIWGFFSRYFFAVVTNRQSFHIICHIMAYKQVFSVIFKIKISGWGLIWYNMRWKCMLMCAWLHIQRSSYICKNISSQSGEVFFSHTQTGCIFNESKWSCIFLGGV